MTITVQKASSPWNVTLARLETLECQVVDNESKGMLARWEFGRELLKRRVPGTGPNKGKQIIPPDLKKLVTNQCAITYSELMYRMKFAEKFTTKKEASDAVGTFPSWRRMTKEGLVKTKRVVKRKKVVHSGPWAIRRLHQELDKAFSHHATLTRDQVKDLEQLAHTITTILRQIDSNDAAKADRKVS